MRLFNFTKATNLDISRRSFLRGALVVSAASVLPVLPAFAEDIPTLYGDGVHDDTLALNALLNREKVRVDGEIVQVTDNFVQLRGGTYAVSGLTIPDMHLIGSSSLSNTTIIRRFKDADAETWVDYAWVPHRLGGIES